MSSTRVLDTRKAFSGRVIDVDVDTIQLSNGSQVDLEIIRHPGAAAVVPLLSEAPQNPRVLLIRQYRFAAQGSIWEIPAGVLEPGEAPEDCAKRELEEETGARASEIEHLTTIFTTPGFTDERIHLFLAKGLTMGESRHQADEEIEIEAKPFREVVEMLQNGTIVDGKSVAALLYMARFSLRI